METDKEFEWHLPKVSVEHVAFRKYKGRKRKMNKYDIKALYNAMLPSEAETEMKGVPLPYHGVIMGTLCAERQEVPIYFVFCYDGYKGVVAENDIVKLPIYKI